jgi:hypothetical protein
MVRGSSPSQFRHQLCINQLNFVRHFRVGGHSDRVFEHHKGQLRIVQGLLVRLGRAQECLGDHTHGGNASLFKVD